MFSQTKAILAAAALTALAATGCQQVPFPMEPLHTANGQPGTAMAGAAHPASTLGLPNNNVQLPLAKVALLAPDVVAELEGRGLEVIPRTDYDDVPAEQVGAPEQVADEPPFKLGPGEYRLVFTPPNVSYRALEDLAFAQAYGQANAAPAAPPVVIQQNFYDASPTLTYGYGYGGYISPLYGGYRAYAPVWGGGRAIVAPVSGFGGYYLNPGAGSPFGGYYRNGGAVVVPGRPFVGGQRFGPVFSTPMAPGTVVPMGPPMMPGMPPGTVVMPR